MFTLRSLRHLKRSPASAAAAVLTVAVTLGAGGTLFALFEAVALTPPPFADPDSLVVLGELPADAAAGPPRAVPVRTFLEWQARRDGLTRLEAYDSTNVTLSGDGPARRLSATSATSGLLDMLGVTPALGRLWTTDEAASRVVVVSHQFWQGQLLGDSAVIGRELVIGGQSFAIVGVLPRTFSFALNVSDLWLPMPVRAGGDGQPLRVIGRLAGRSGARCRRRRGNPGTASRR